MAFGQMQDDRIAIELLVSAGGSLAEGEHACDTFKYLLRVAADCEIISFRSCS